MTTTKNEQVSLSLFVLALGKNFIESEKLTLFNI
jgi:hypothetical protein